MILYQSENSGVPYNLDVRVYDDFRYVPHLHLDFEMIYVLEGEVEVNVDGVCEKIGKGEMGLILQNRVHSYETPAHSRVWVCVFSSDHVKDFARVVRSKSCQSCRLVPDKDVRELVKARLVDETPQGLVLSSLLSLVCSLFYSSRSFFDSARGDDALFHSILGYISERFRENLTQRQMARDLGYEPHYLSRYFNSFFGRSFRTLLNEYRINYAKSLMSRPGISLSSVALESGFQSVRSFNRAWLESEGEEPRVTRKRLSGGEENE